MTLEAILPAIGTILAIWRIMAYYETRNDSAHAKLGAGIDKLTDNVNQLTVTVTAIGKDLEYLRKDFDYYRERQERDDANQRAAAP